jgi:hypothetical protein
VNFSPQNIHLVDKPNSPPKTNNNVRYPQITPTTLNKEDEWELFDEALRKGQSLSFRVCEGSMIPTLYPGDRIRITKKNLNIRDIIVFRFGSSWMVKRIVSKSGENIVLQGDAGQNNKVVTISTTNVLGVVSLRPNVHLRRLLLKCVWKIRKMWASP